MTAGPWTALSGLESFWGEQTRALPQATLDRPVGALEFHAEGALHAGYGQVPKNSPATLGNGNSTPSASTPLDDDESNNSPVNLEETAYDQISRLILAQFKGHGLADLVGAILEAQNYVVHQPPPGPDHGVDLLASSGPLGFGDPRICVQVKCTDSPIERVVLDQLIGTMQNFNAQFGLLVSWGGFKQSVERERANQFFRVRLWNRDDFIDQLLNHYDQLDEELRSKLPLKRIWMP